MLSCILYVLQSSIGMYGLVNRDWAASSSTGSLPACNNHSHECLGALYNQSTGVFVHVHGEAVMASSMQHMRWDTGALHTLGCGSYSNRLCLLLRRTTRGWLDHIQLP
jgi:hypothetical protein